jgi:hypothetical protein
MEQRFGADFGDVRLIQNLEKQVACTSDLGFARGEHVFLDPAIAPSSALGHIVLSHELVHVLQQRNGAAGFPLSSPANLEAAARVSGSESTSAAALGAAPPGVAQFFDIKEQPEFSRVPFTPQQDEQWAAQLATDQTQLIEIMSSAYYNEADEEAALAILWRWAERRSPAAEEQAKRASFDLRSDLLDRLLEALQRRSVWTLEGRMTCYEALFSRFERADEARTIRDQSSIRFVGREAHLDQARDEDIFAEHLLGSGANELIYLGVNDSLDAAKKADWVIARLAEIPLDRLTPMQRALSEGYSREGRDFFLRRYRWNTAGDKLRRAKAVGREVVVMVLDYALIELTMGIAAATMPRVLELALGSSRPLKAAESAGSLGGAIETGEAAIGETVSITSKAGPSTAAAKLESITGETAPLTFYPMRQMSEMAPATARNLAADTERLAIRPNPPFGKTPMLIETPEPAFIPSGGAGPNRAGRAEARIEAPGRVSNPGPAATKSEETLFAGGKSKAPGGKKPQSSPVLETTESGITGDLKTDPRSGGSASEIVGIERDAELVKLNDWFKDLDAVRGGKITSSRVGDKIVVEFEGGIGVQHKATFLDDNLTNLRYVERKINEAADRLIAYTDYQKTLSGVTHSVKNLSGRELHLVWDQQSIIMNERQLFDVMEKIKVDLASKGVDFRWYVDSFGRRFEGQSWFGNKMKFFEDL